MKISCEWTEKATTDGKIRGSRLIELWEREEREKWRENSEAKRTSDTNERKRGEGENRWSHESLKKKSCSLSPTVSFFSDYKLSLPMFGVVYYNRDDRQGIGKWQWHSTIIAFIWFAGLGIMTVCSHWRAFFYVGPSTLHTFETL